MSASTKPTANPELSSVFDLASRSAKIVRENWKLFALVNILNIIATIGSIFSSMESGTSMNQIGLFGADTGFSAQQTGLFISIGLVFLVVIGLIALFLYAMTIDLELRTSRGEKPDLSKITEAAKIYWIRMLGLFIVGGLIIVAGLILLIIPGIFAAIRLSYAPYLMIDRKLGVIESLKASNEFIKGRMWPVIAALLLLIGIAILASFLSIIPVLGPVAGLVITIAYSMISVLRYQELKTNGHLVG
jgi:hypothetical protein